MTKRSIIFCINYMHTGGVEKSLLSLVRALPRDIFDVHIALMQNKGDLLPEIPADVTVHILSRIEHNKPRLGYPLRHATDLAGPLSYLAAKVRGTLIHYYHHILGDERDLTGHFDIAVSYQGPSQLLDWYVPTHIDADKYVSWIHFDIARSFINPCTGHKVYPLFDRIFVVGEGARRSFVNVFPEVADRCEVFHNIVDAAAVRAASTAYAVERPDGCLVLCTVGRMHPAKAPDVAIEVAAELKRRGIRFRWYWVGGDELLEPCRRDAAARGLDDSLHFTGLKSNPYPYMAAADVYVQPSRHEGYCITLAEARAFGMPVVCTGFSGAEQLDGTENGIVVRTHEAAAIADAIVKASAMPHITPPDTLTANDIQKLIDL